MSTTDNTRDLLVDGHRLRIDVRTGQPGVVGADSDVRGEGAGRVPLLLINGIGASLELLEPFVAELDPALEVIRFDVPGVGGSPPPARPYRFGGLCRLIAAMLAALGHSQADVLGISWGGGVAQHFAFAQRDHCRRLVLVATGPGALMVPGKPSVLAKLVTRKRYTDPGYMERIAADLYGGSARDQSAAVATALRGHNLIGSARGYAFQVAAGTGWTSLPFLPRLRQRTLILAGDDDPIIPVINGRLMHRLIPGSQLHVYHGGHLGLVTEASELGPVVSRFLAARLRGAEASRKGDRAWSQSWTRTSTSWRSYSTTTAAGCCCGSGTSWRSRWPRSSTTTGPARSSRTTWCPRSRGSASPGWPARGTSAPAAAACSTA
jgi:poly(3-hydroxyalkanoate) depolymerase